MDYVLYGMVIQSYIYQCTYIHTLFGGRASQINQPSESIFIFDSTLCLHLSGSRAAGNKSIEVRVVGSTLCKRQELVSYHALPLMFEFSILTITIHLYDKHFLIQDFWEKEYFLLSLFSFEIV